MTTDNQTEPTAAIDGAPRTLSDASALVRLGVEVLRMRAATDATLEAAVRALDVALGVLEGLDGGGGDPRPAAPVARLRALPSKAKRTTSAAEARADAIRVHAGSVSAILELVAEELEGSRAAMALDGAVELLDVLAFEAEELGREVAS
jgi:hypothetical protein